MNLWKILLNYLLLNLSTRRTVVMSCSQLYKKYGQWRLITTVITVFEPGILLPVIQVQFYYVISVCSGYWFGISCTRCYFVVPCKVITYVVWCAWMITCFFNCTGSSLLLSKWRGRRRLNSFSCRRYEKFRWNSECSLFWFVTNINWCTNTYSIATCTHTHAPTHQKNNIDLAKLKSGNRIIITIKGGMEM